MLGDAGSLASIVGVLVSFFGLGFAIAQILKLQGETQATRKAAEETRRAVDREIASISLARVNERIEGLKDLHRQGEWNRALDRYPEIGRMLIDIRSRHPGMSEEQRTTIQGVIAQLNEMGKVVESADGGVPQEETHRFNLQLLDDQLALSEIESELQQSQST